MKTAPSLTLVAVGGVLAFAIHGHPSFVNLQVAGWILILTGVAGLAVQFWQRGRLQRWWAVLTGDLVGPAAAEIDAMAGLRPAVATSPQLVAVDPEAPDSGYPTLPSL
jgi:uncharacterized membrane protein HdeD (DUF308 family)